jgi:hypothetical protein
MEMHRSETFPFEISSIVWCPSMELYGVIAQDDAQFQVKRCSSGKHSVFEVSGEVAQFIFMDEKALTSVVGYTDGKIDVINTDDGKVLFSINQSQDRPVSIDVVEHHKNASKKSKLQKEGKRTFGTKQNPFLNSSAQKFLLPIEYNEATKNLKRKLKYFESFENPCFLFLADEKNNLSIYLNSCFLIAKVNMAEVCGTEGVLAGVESFKIDKIKAAKDLSKLFLQIQIENSSYLSIVDTRFFGYKSGMITDISKLLFEANEHIKFIENKTEE